MKCPGCSSKVDHSNLVTSPEGEEYYVCPNCERRLVHRMGIGKVFLAAVIALPVLSFLLDLLLAVLIGPLVGNATILGFEVVEAVSVFVSIIAVVALATFSIRLVEQ